MLQRQREVWPGYMQDVDDNISFNGGPDTLRRLTRDFASGMYPIPHWFEDIGYYRFAGERLQQYYSQTLDLVAVTRLRMKFQRFINNLKKLVARRRYRIHNAYHMGPWLGTGV